MNSQERILEIFLRLLDGETLSKRELMETYKKDASSIQRDIKVVQHAIENRAQAHYLEKGSNEGLFYEEYLQRQSLQRFGKGLYKIDHFEGVTANSSLTDTELMVILKVLLASRALETQEMKTLCQKLLDFADDRKDLTRAIANEEFYYQGVPKQAVLLSVEMICDAIVNYHKIRFEYEKLGENTVLERIPRAIYFSDMYLYMLTDNHKAQDDDQIESLSKFRINNMRNIQVVSIRNKVDIVNRFEGGLLRKQTNLAFLGKPITLVVDFFWDPVYVLDRFPDSRIISETNGVYRIEMQVNDGYGMKMWLLSQGDMVKVISPQHMKDYIINDMKDALAYYGYEVREKEGHKQYDDR